MPQAKKPTQEAQTGPIEPKTTAVRDADGNIIEIPYERPVPPKLVPDGNGGYVVQEAQTANSYQMNLLAGVIDMKAAGLGVSKTTHVSTFEIAPFKFRLRLVGRNVLLADDAFTNHIIEELGLEALAAKILDFSSYPDPDAARKGTALAIYQNEGFRADYPELSQRADELQAERYEQVLLGLNPDSDNPDDWGSLVGWQVSGVPERLCPFGPDMVRALLLPTKRALHERSMSLSRVGDNDAQFRRARGF